MLDFSTDRKVFIRSMASRGRIGGLSSSTYDSICLLDAFGFDKIIVETVGAGQNEVDIYQQCDTTVVVSVPGLGDDIQSIKAGIYEIPDIFAVNKGDLGGADELTVQLQMMLDMHNSNNEWRIPVLKISSRSDFGFEEFIDNIESHLIYLNSSNKLIFRRNERIKSEVIFKIQKLILSQFENNQISLETLISEKIKENTPPSIIAQDLLKELEKR